MLVILKGYPPGPENDCSCELCKAMDKCEEDWQEWLPRTTMERLVWESINRLEDVSDDQGE